VEVQVLRIEKSDDPRKPEKISLSLKSLEKDPWQDAVERFPEGARLRGKVARLEAFGAFVELSPGVEGLVHVSELGKGVKHPKQALKIGEEIQVTVLGVDGERRRISLSLGAGARDGEGGDEGDYVPPRPEARGFGTLGDLLNKKKR
jgi:small subunit ribosomal protein S1